MLDQGPGAAEEYGWPEGAPVLLLAFKYEGLDVSRVCETSKKVWWLAVRVISMLVKQERRAVQGVQMQGLTLLNLRNEL